MTDALTGNTMIPSNPGVAVNQVQQGAQQVAPQSAGAPPMVGQVPAPVAQPPVVVQPPVPVESYDFWTSVEERVEPGTQVAPLPPVQAPAPQQLVAPVPDQVQPYAPQVPAITPEQQAAIVEAGALEHGVPQAPAPQPQPMQQAQALEAQTIAHLAKTEYALPAAEATRLVSEPEVAFPELAARLHVRLATQIGQAVQQILPGVIEQVVDAKLKAQNLENDFFRSYPQLADPRFRPVVANSLRMARQASPNAGRAQVMSDGAALAAMKLRLQLTNGVQQPVVVPQPPGIPPVQPPLQPQGPFQPAVGGGVGLPIQTQVPMNEFEELAMDQNW